MRWRSAARPAALAAMLLLLPACGYRFGVAPQAEIKRLAVPLFDNDTLYRKLELQLTERVQQEVRRRFKVKLSTPEKADAILRGRIIQVRERVLVEGADDEILEGAVDVTVEAELIDLRGGQERLLAARRRQGQGTWLLRMVDGSEVGAEKLERRGERYWLRLASAGRGERQIDVAQVARLVKIGPPLVERAERVPERGEILDDAFDEALDDLAERIALLLERWE